jgi:hypothetical protein
VRWAERDEDGLLVLPGQPTAALGNDRALTGPSRKESGDTPSRLPRRPIGEPGADKGPADEDQAWRESFLLAKSSETGSLLWISDRLALVRVVLQWRLRESSNSREVRTS